MSVHKKTLENSTRNEMFEMHILKIIKYML